jgi:Tfp pilus assembly protein PilP
VPYALIQTPPPNKPKHVRVGEYMGRNFRQDHGDHFREAITVVETVKDANGAWVSQEKLLIVPKEGGR